MIYDFYQHIDEEVSDFEKILDVPYYSQFTEIEVNGLEDLWKRRSCGILCLKMVMDYWREKAGMDVPSLPALIHVAQELDALAPDGDWKHDGLVRTAEQFGFTAWRRKWIHSEEEQKLFASWGWSERGIAAASEQTAREGVMTLTSAIVADVPVIVSVPKEFNIVPKRHLIVLTGVRKDPLLGVYRGFYVNDPYNPAQGKKPRGERKDEFVTQEKFIHNWNKRAIFVVPPDYVGAAAIQTDTP